MTDKQKVDAKIVDKIARPITEKFFYSQDAPPAEPDFLPGDFLAGDFKTE